MLNFYPPLLFQRIRVREISPDYRRCRVVVKRSLLTRNLHGTTFGGTLFSACDPIYPVLYWQVFAREGERLQVWLKAAEVDYRKPAATDLELRFELGEEDLDAAREGLAARGRVVRIHSTEAVDREGEACAVFKTVVFLRRTGAGRPEVSGF